MPGDRQRSAVVSRAESYAVDDVLPVPGFERVPAGTRLLVTGPSMTGKRDLAYRLAGRGLPEQSAVVVTTDTPARQVRSAFDGSSENSGIALKMSRSWTSIFSRRSKISSSLRYL